MNAFACLLLCLCGGDTKTACTELNGFYWCWKEDGCCEPAGVVCIAHHEGTYVITWTYSPEVDEKGNFTITNANGVGRRHGKALAVLSGKQVYAYEIQIGAKGHVAISGEGERWQKIKPPCCVDAPAPVARSFGIWPPGPRPHPAPPCRCEDCKCRKAGHDCRCGKGDGCDCVISVVEHEDGTKETTVAPPPKSHPDYDHLPPEKVCGECHAAATAWKAGLERQALDLGWMCIVPDAVEWEGPRAIWTGGGWQAKLLQDEIEECKTLIRVWWVTWMLRWPHTAEEELPVYEAELRSLIGHAAYVRGQIPGPFPRTQARQH